LPELSTLQCQYREILTSIAIGGSAYLPTLLLIGPPGAGKRTIARATAEALGMEFVDVRVDGVAKNVEEMLFGTLIEAQNASDRRAAPGILGGASSTLVYLSGIENLEPSLWNSFSLVTSTKTFKDILGNSWRISTDVWIVGALKVSSSEFLIGPEHWLCTTFEQRTRISPPTDVSDLLAICRSILSELPGSPTLDASLTEFFTDKPSISDHLHSIRRWIEIASSPHRGGGPLTRGRLEAAMVDDLEWALARLTYRGVTLTPAQFSRWADQFNHDLRPMAAHLVRQIADHYFIGSANFYQVLDEVIARSEIQPDTPVAFCRCEPLGKSSPRVAHAIKNQAKWKTVVDVDLSADPRTWPNLSARGVRHVILADDFIGSGKTLSKLFLGGNGPLSLLLHRNPEVSLYVLVVAGFEYGFRKIKFAIPVQLMKRVRMIAGHLFTSRDQCFEGKSRILTSDEKRNALRQFCLDMAAAHYPNLHPDSRLGFGAIGALVVFADTIPNNSLPILWHDSGSWVPLFPASGLPAS
jgi:DNA polymerase III delta prime subunit